MSPSPRRLPRLPPGADPDDRHRHPASGATCFGANNYGAGLLAGRLARLQLSPAAGPPRSGNPAVMLSIASPIEHFNRAIALDPQYAAPYAALAHAWWMRGVVGPLSFKEVATPAREAAQTALARDDRNVEAYAALAYVQGMFDWDWKSAQSTVQRAVTLEPNSVDAHYVHALLLMAMNRLDEAVSEIDYAARLDPLSAQVQSTYGRILYRARRFDAARIRLERALELEPRNAQVYGRLADVHDQLGRYDDALGLLDQRDAISGLRAIAARARILARAGRAAEARELLAAVPPQNPQRAEVFAALGDHEAAFTSLFRTLDERDSWLLFIKSDPNLEGLHRDPRWAAVLRRMNLAE